MTKAAIVKRASKKRSWIRDLQRILAFAIISPRLKYAVEETLKAIQEHNWELAYQLTAVKSYIIGAIDPKDKKHAFQENHEANEKNLTDSVYSTLDGMHHNIAFAMDKLPSGTMAVSRNGGITQMKSKGTHPTIRRIKWEHRTILKDAEKAIKARGTKKMTSIT